MIEALLYEKLGNELVRCNLCNHHCKIAENNHGFCGVRENIKGILYTNSYGKIVASNIDPIEKKPLYNFLPGSKSFSIAAAGCNFRCGFCQNWQISQVLPKSDAILGQELAPLSIIKQAIRNNCKSISYTYTEPTIFFEYAFETAKLARENSLSNIFVTNGYMTEECLKMVSPYLDATNIDLKFFSEQSYNKICKAKLGPVLDSIKLMHKLGVWIEITTLIIPKLNDSVEELSDIANFIAKLDKNIPWHVSRFHPDYEFEDFDLTSDETLRKAQKIGISAGLNFVYAGNVFGWGSDTICPACKKTIIKREGFSILEYNVKKCKCGFCKEIIPGVFS